MANKDGTQENTDKGQQSTPVLTQEKTDGTPSKTFTQAEVDQLMQAHDTRVGRENKTNIETIGTLTAQADKNTAERTGLLTRIDALEVANIKDDPIKLSAYQASKTARDAESVAAARKADLDKREAVIVAKETTASTTERATIVTTYTNLGIAKEVIDNLATVPNSNLQAILDSFLPEDKRLLNKTVTGEKGQVLTNAVGGIKSVDSNRTIGGVNREGLSSLDKINSGLKDRNK